VSARRGGLQPALASLAAGLAAAFAHPPFGFLPGLLGYALLLVLLDRSSAERPLRSAFWRAWLAGAAYFAVSTWWVTEAFLVDAKHQGWMAPFALTFLAGGLALFWGAAGALYRVAAPAGARRLLVFAGALAGLEWLRGHVFTGFPWDLPGETWTAGSAPSQAASVLGAYGLTFVTIAIAAAPGLGWRRTGERVALTLALAALLGLYGFGAVRLAGATATPEPGAPVVRIVQPDTPERADYDAQAFADVARRNLTLTAQPSARKPDVVIWSEAGLPAALEDYLAPGTWTRAAIEATLSPGQTLITGGFRAQAARPGAYAPRGLSYFNSLLTLRRTAEGLSIDALYDKHHLAPFGEYIPFQRYLAPLGVEELTHMGPGFTPGPASRPLAPPGVPAFQPLICYESLFPELARDGVLAGRPAWIVNISDDAWFGATSGPWQHLNLASYRAIEEGLPMVRATPTGVSAVVDAYGRVVPGKILGEGDYGVIDSPLPRSLAPTPFERYGDAFFYAMVFAAGAVAMRRSVTLRFLSKG